MVLGCHSELAQTLNISARMRAVLEPTSEALSVADICGMEPASAGIVPIWEHFPAADFPQERTCLCSTTSGRAQAPRRR
jgi:hypothetical protein